MVPPVAFSNKTQTPYINLTTCTLIWGPSFPSPFSRNVTYNNLVQHRAQQRPPVSLSRASVFHKTPKCEQTDTWSVPVTMGKHLSYDTKGPPSPGLAYNHVYQLLRGSTVTFPPSTLTTVHLDRIKEVTQPACWKAGLCYPPGSAAACRACRWRAGSPTGRMKCGSQLIFTRLWQTRPELWSFPRSFWRRGHFLNAPRLCSHLYSRWFVSQAWGQWGGKTL